MNREKILRVRLSEEEWTKLETYAQSKEHTISEVIRDYIKRLPRQDKSCIQPSPKGRRQRRTSPI